jgi:diguanylate cyclase (GGDEF)-like protein
LDAFKAINDTFGHAAGDRVLKTLANMLQQRLRKSDYIGRIGGEEFAVVFTDTNEATAVHVMDEIRTRFSQVKHYCETREFNVTFSCGIATRENSDEPAALSQAADEALYQAKHAGRNQIVVAQI